MASYDDFDVQGITRWRRGLLVQKRVIIALIIRMMMTKYGRSNIGFLWIVAEPMILCSGVLVVRSFVQGGTEEGLPLIALLVTGYLPLTLWRHLSNSGIFLLRRAGPLLYHRDIGLLDFAISMVLIELAGCTLAATIVYFVLYSLKLIQPIYDLALVICGWLMMMGISAAVMMVFAIWTERWEASERFILPTQYITLPICGFFFMVYWLPPDIQKMAWWVPTVHCYEMVRAGVFGPAVPTFYTPWYPLIWTLGMLGWALPALDKARATMHIS